MNIAVDSVFVVVGKHRLISVNEEKNTHAKARLKLIKDKEKARPVIRCALCSDVRES